MAEYSLTSPLDLDEVRALRIGDIVYVSGKAFSCRSRLQRRVLDEGNPPPNAAIERDILIHAGPIVLYNEKKYDLVSFMPTSSIRFEKWGAKSIEAWGLHMIIGKTTMGSETIEMMRKRLCVHVSPQGVSPNLWTSSIEIEGVELFEELGSIEATWHLKLNRLGPFIVDIDTNGDNFFQKRDAELLENRRKAYELLGIPLDFEYTRLYYEFDKEGK